jgi:hypothetical protein
LEGGSEFVAVITGDFIHRYSEVYSRELTRSFVEFENLFSFVQLTSDPAAYRPVNFAIQNIGQDLRPCETVWIWKENLEIPSEYPVFSIQCPGIPGSGSFCDMIQPPAIAV